MTTSKQPIAPYLWMTCGCFFLAWMGQFAHLLKDTCDWRVVALVRAGLAFVFAFGLAKLSGAQLVFLKPIALWVRGCASSISLLCTFFAFTALPTAEVLTLTNSFPIWVAFLSWPLLHVRPSAGSCLAAGVGVVGVALIQSPHIAFSGGASYAVLLAVAAALTNAVAMLGLHRLKGVHPWAIVTHYSGLATVFVLGTCFIGESPLYSTILSPTVVLLLLGVGISATLGQACVTKAFTCGQPTRVSVVALLQVVFALALDVWIGDVALEPIALVGIALVLAPTSIVVLATLNMRTPAHTASMNAQDSARHDAMAPPASQTVKICVPWRAWCFAGENQTASRNAGDATR
ncbi:MAG TPA: DMT family transporter [Gemmataceae bacterium]|nr:DMT family transporter [Gemmataceae bacterium]